jgi:eukaryotic-like serine/threonine-protein kinase
MAFQRPEYSPVNEVIGQRYKILRQLREEPWGGVWLAQDYLLGVEVSVKLLPREAPEWDAAQKIFQQEAILALRLRHPQILGVYHLEKTERFLYLVEEPFAGESLMARLHRQQRFSVPQALQLLEQLSQALAFVHEQGEVHQSLNPLHLLLEGDEVRLADFAFPNVSGHEAIYLELKAYDPPEVIRGETLTAAGNVFSLGVLGFRLVAGSLPYPLTFDEPFPYRLEIPPADLQEVPIPLQNVLLRCLAEDPEERFSQASAFLAQLRQAREFLRGKPRDKYAAWKPEARAGTWKSAAQAGAIAGKLWSEAKPRGKAILAHAPTYGKTVWNAAKAAPRRFWWGLGLAGLLIVLMYAGLTRKAPTPPPQPPIIAAPATPQPAAGPGPPRLESQEQVPTREVIKPAPLPAPATTPTREAIKAPAPAATSAAEATKPAKEERYLLVAATYPNEKQAQALQQRLRSRNFRAKIVISKTGDKTLYQVQVGPITGVKAAEEAAAKIKAQEKIAPKMVKMTKKPSNPPKPRKPAQPGNTAGAGSPPR